MSQLVEFSYVTGQTLTAELYAEGADTITATADSVTQQTNRNNVYRASFTGVAVGVYSIVVKLSGTAVATGWVHIEAASGTFQVLDRVIQIGGGGDATEANQFEIIAILQGNTVSPQNALTPSGNLVVYNRRTYDGVAHPFISFSTTKNYTTATTLELILHAKDNVDNVYQTLTATASSATLIRASGTISLDSLTYAGCPLTAQIAYTLRATWTTAEETIATGGAYVYAQP